MIRISKALVRWGKGLRYCMPRGEGGAALITALMFLIILTALGMASVMTASTEMMISRNYRLEKLSLDYANAGVQEAMARMDMPVGSITPDLGNSSVMTDEADPADDDAWDFSSSDGGLNLGGIRFDGTVRYYLEDERHMRDWYGTPNDNNEIVGYSQDCGYPKSPVAHVDKSLPVYVITSTGKVMSGSEVVASSTVKVEVTKNALNLDVPAGLYSNGCITASGTTNLYGSTNCPPPAADLPSYMTPCTGGSNGVNGSPTMSPAGEGGVTSIDMTSPANFLGVPLEDVMNLAKGAGTYYEMTSAGPPSVWSGYAPFSVQAGKDYTSGYGDLTDPSNPTDPKIVYIKMPPGATYSMPSNTDSFGILVVEGNISIAGNTYWKGLIYVTGDLHADSGVATVDGGIMAGGSTGTSLNGTITVRYDCQALKDVAKKAFQTKMLNWRRIYN